MKGNLLAKRKKHLLILRCNAQALPENFLAVVSTLSSAKASGKAFN
jgi:hypothetical protein